MIPGTSAMSNRFGHYSLYNRQLSHLLAQLKHCIRQICAGPFRHLLKLGSAVGIGKRIDDMIDRVEMLKVPWPCGPVESSTSECP
jgi:predicted TPR repeat methyltransferase